MFDFVRKGHLHIQSRPVMTPRQDEGQLGLVRGGMCRSQQRSIEQPHEPRRSIGITASCGVSLLGQCWWSSASAHRPAAEKQR